MRVLIATDVSPVSQVTLNEVAARPWPTAAELRLLHIVDPLPFATTPSLIPLAVKGAQETLEKVAESLERPGIDVSMVVVEGHPAKSIVEAARAWHADLVVVGSRGVRPIGRFLLGSTASAVLRSAPCAVEIVRCPRRDRPPSRNNGRRILLATDGSTCSERAVESVAERPWPVGSEVRVISVPVFAGPAIKGGYIDAEAWEAIRGSAVIEANRAVDEALNRLQNARLKADGTVPTGLEGPKASILDEAER
jgi:nucleotide-binding universal stress UspA family protein